MSGTMTSYYRGLLENLTTVKIPPKCCLWPDWRHFQQRSIKHEYENHTNHFSGGIDHVVDILLNTVPGEHHDGDERVVIFATLAAKSSVILKKVERRLNERKSKIDTIHVNGPMHKFQKFWLIRYFCETVKNTYFNPRVMISTGAANTGFDFALLKFILCWGFSPDLPTF